MRFWARFLKPKTLKLKTHGKSRPLAFPVLILIHLKRTFSMDGIVEPDDFVFFFNPESAGDEFGNEDDDQGSDAAE